MTPNEMSTIRRTNPQAATSGAARRIARALGALTLAALAVIACGCGDDDENPMDLDTDDEPDRSTPVALIEKFFEVAYSSQDSTLYRAMLDDEFRFGFLGVDADSLRAMFGPSVVGPDDAWDRDADLQSTEAMFGSADVTGITLNLSVNSTAAFPDTMGCVGCKQLETTVTLRINTVGDGTEPLTFTVDSPQTFIAKPDSADTTKWVLWRQHDRPRSAPRGIGTDSATENKSWGELKGLYFPAPALPRPQRNTPALLLTDFFEAAYSRRDSVLYEEMLDAGFQFEFLPEDADTLRDVLGVDNFWGKPLDLRSTGNMFRSPDVTGVTLNLQVNSNNVYVGGDCVGCRQLESTVTLRVATIGDGTEPLTLTVDEAATFVAKRDPENSSQWVLFRQRDLPRAIANGDVVRSETATEGKNWGALKALFF